jgi:hypothetical protein
MWHEWILVIGFLGIMGIGVWALSSALDHRD